MAKSITDNLDQYLEICALLDRGKTYMEIIGIMNISRTPIAKVKKHRVLDPQFEVSARLALKPKVKVSTKIVPRVPKSVPISTKIVPRSTISDVDIDAFFTWIMTRDSTKFFEQRRAVINRCQKHKRPGLVSGTLQLYRIFIRGI